MERELYPITWACTSTSFYRGMDTHELSQGFAGSFNVNPMALMSVLAVAQSKSLLFHQHL